MASEKKNQARLWFETIFQCIYGKNENFRKYKASLSRHTNCSFKNKQEYFKYSKEPFQYLNPNIPMFHSTTITTYSSTI